MFFVKALRDFWRGNNVTHSLLVRFRKYVSYTRSIANQYHSVIWTKRTNVDVRRNVSRIIFILRDVIFKFVCDDIGCDLCNLVIAFFAMDGRLPLCLDQTSHQIQTDLNPGKTVFQMK
ncbi:hypothetical protein PGB90_009117 [Kerria lacca]